MAQHLCILISTCDRYRALAEYTRSEIGAQWPQHPPIRLCGIREVPDALPLRDDPANWMRVTRSACADLRGQGFRMVYLLLEDHPPFGPCHSEHLNETLPSAMDHFGATCIALSGPGQHRQWHGSRARFGKYTFDHIHRDALWKFPLHPALWNLDRLIELLDLLMRQLPESEHTPWAFERKGGDASMELPDALKAGSYRVLGSQMAVLPLFWLRRAPVYALQFIMDVFRFLVRIIKGDAARQRADAALWGIYCPYDGPYPLFWSGIMRKGAFSRDLQLWLKLTGQSALLRRIRTHLPA